MNALQTAIVLWLSATFDLPATYEHPNVEFVPAVEIAFLHYGALMAEKRREALAQYRSNISLDKRREVVAVYIDATKTIFLPEGWTGSSPAELSVLVHEMVHHLQNVARLKFECPQAREQLAYAAQERWLGLFGRNLLEDFEIDPLTLLMSTRCGY